MGEGDGQRSGAVRAASSAFPHAPRGGAGRPRQPPGGRPRARRILAGSDAAGQQQQPRQQAEAHDRLHEEQETAGESSGNQNLEHSRLSGSETGKKITQLEEHH